MSRVIIIKGKDYKGSFEVPEGEDFGVYARAATMSIELHNSAHPDDWWVWGEAGTQNDPTIVPTE